MVVLLEEEMVGKMVEHHGIGRVNGVGPAQLLNPVPDGVGGLAVQLEHGNAHHGAHAVRIQLERALKGQARLVDMAQLEEAVAHAQAHAGRTARIRAQGFLVVSQCTLGQGEKKMVFTET